MRRGPQSLLEALAGTQHSSAMEAPPPANPPQPTGAAGATNPGAALLAAYQAWKDRTGREADPLLARVGQRQHVAGAWGVARNDPAKLLSQSAPLEVTHGPNAGRQAFAVDLGDGRRAHVYFDERGQRQVRVFRA